MRERSSLVLWEDIRNGFRGHGACADASLANPARPYPILLINFSLFTLPIPQAIVLGKSQTRDHGCFIPLDPLDEALEFANLAGSTFR